MMSHVRFSKITANILILDFKLTKVQTLFDIDTLY